MYVVCSPFRYKTEYLKTINIFNNCENKNKINAMPKSFYFPTSSPSIITMLPPSYILSVSRTPSKEKRFVRIGAYLEAIVKMLAYDQK